MPSCYFCEAFDAEWVHQLDWARSTFRLYGKGHTFGGSVDFCDRCEELYRAGDDEALVAIERRTRELDDAAAVAEEIRKPLAVLRGADLGAVRLDSLLPPGAADLRAAGFTPIGFLTGAEDIAQVWPHEHRRSVPQTEPERLAEGEHRYWLVRSPWPSIDVHEVFELMWPWVEHRAAFLKPGQLFARIGVEDKQRRQAAVAAFLALPEPAVLALRRHESDDDDQSDLPPE